MGGGRDPKLTPLLSFRSAEGEAEAAEPPAVEMSLDEWKALQKQSRPKAEFNIRKADTSVPSDSMVIHKSKKALEVRMEQNPNGTPQQCVIVEA